MDRQPPQGRGEVYGFYLHPDAWGSGRGSRDHGRGRRRLASSATPRQSWWVLEDNPRGQLSTQKAGWRPTGGQIMFDYYCDEPAPEIEYRRELA